MHTIKNEIKDEVVKQEVDDSDDYINHIDNGLVNGFNGYNERTRDLDLCNKQDAVLSSDIVDHSEIQPTKIMTDTYDGIDSPLEPTAFVHISEDEYDDGPGPSDPLSLDDISP